MGGERWHERGTVVWEGNGGMGGERWYGRRTATWEGILNDFEVVQ